MRTFRLAVVLAGLVACNALTGVNAFETSETDLDGGASSSSSSSGSGGGDGSSDASSDATAFDGGQPLAAVDIVDVGTADKSTGLSNQHHLVWAPIAARWVLFYVSSASPSTLKTKLSPDFVTWTDGADLALPHPHAGEGRNVAVARATLGGKDVFHVSLSFRIALDDHRAYAARGVLSGEQLAWSTPAEVTRSIQGQVDLDPDGASIAISNDGFVTLFTGYRTNNPDGGGTGNAYALRSSVADDGVAAFAPSWSSTTIEVVPTICNARASVPIGGTDLLFVYENGDTQPDPKNLRWSRSTGAIWSAELSVFGAASTMDPADWTIHRVTDTGVHIVRRTTAGALDHRRYDGTTLQTGGTIADDALQTGAGITLLPLDEPSMMLAAIGTGETVRATTWNGQAWSAWTTLLPGAGGTRRWLSSGGAAVGPSAVVWTENRGASHVIAGVRIR